MTTKSNYTSTEFAQRVAFNKFKKEESAKIFKRINYPAMGVAAVIALISTLVALANLEPGPFVMGIFTAISAYISIWVYLIPTYFAYTRCIGSRLPVFLINLLTGWTIIPWAITLIWGLCGSETWVNEFKKREEEKHYY
jgi:hypothetical protein